MRWTWLVVVLAGCYEPRTLTGASDAGSGSDADADTSSDGQSGICFGDSGSLVQFCLPALPSGPVSTDIDTVNSADCDLVMVDGQAACVLAAAQLPGATVTVHGANPLILVANGKLDINSNVLIDFVAASDGARIGCTATTTNAPAGGAGGSYGTEGGAGGDSDTGTHDGAGASTPYLPALAGGCPGGPGGRHTGAGGLGGGAIAVMARGAISIEGFLDVSGGGGFGASGAGVGGGAGGGAGGMIYLDVPAGSTITLSGGILLANGGGGAGGHDGTGTSMASNGQSAEGRASMPAPGGVGPNGVNGFGGTGSFTGIQAGRGGDGATNSTAIGGGGGGGGAGYILAHNAMPTVLSGSVITPPATTH